MAKTPSLARTLDLEASVVLRTEADGAFTAGTSTSPAADVGYANMLCDVTINLITAVDGANMMLEMAMDDGTGSPGTFVPIVEFQISGANTPSGSTVVYPLYNSVRKNGPVYQYIRLTADGVTGGNVFDASLVKRHP